MSAANSPLAEEQVSCPICLEVFVQPVTLQCGHNFCKSCITRHLNFNSQRQCPMCKERVDRKYKLVVNTLVSEMAVHFRQSATNRKKPGKCFGTEVVALCLLACLVVYFAFNFNLHQTLSSLKTDQPFDPVENVVGRTCRKHGKPLELYCKNEQRPICRSCADSTHRFHRVVPLEEEYETKKAELRKTEAGIQQMILERQRKNQEIKHSLNLSKEAAEREMADGVHVFTALIESLKAAQAELVGTIEEKQKTTEKQAKDFIRELEQEISELMRRRAEVEQLSHSEDHLHFLQSFSSLNSAPRIRDWTEVSVCPTLYEGHARTAVEGSLDPLKETFEQEMKKLDEAQMRSFQQSAVDVTLDPDTAHPALILSDDRKQVHCGDAWNDVPDSSKRFDPSIFVLGKQSFSCGRFHYNVQVEGKTGWTLGVATDSANRKGRIGLSPENGYWSISLWDGQYVAHDIDPVSLSVNHHPEQVRVFVDYDEGLVSFYDISAAALLYSFTGCSFTEKLHPFFSPGLSDSGRNSAPLIITPVNQYRRN